MEAMHKQNKIDAQDCIFHPDQKFFRPSYQMRRPTYYTDLTWDYVASIYLQHELNDCMLST